VPDKEKQLRSEEHSSKQHKQLNVKIAWLHKLSNSKNKCRVMKNNDKRERFLLEENVKDDATSITVNNNVFLINNPGLRMRSKLRWRNAKYHKRLSCDVFLKELFVIMLYVMLRLSLQWLTAFSVKGGCFCGLTRSFRLLECLLE
jgi:hypothetical protein